MDDYEKLIDMFIEINFPQLKYFQKILLKQILLRRVGVPIAYIPSRNIRMGGLRANSKIYNELNKRKENDDEPEKR